MKRRRTGLASFLVCSLAASAEASYAYGLIPAEHLSLLRRQIGVANTTSAAPADCVSTCQPFNTQIQNCNFEYSSNATLSSQCLCQTGVLSAARACAGCASSSPQYDATQREQAVNAYNQFLIGCTKSGFAVTQSTPSASTSIVMSSPSASCVCKSGAGRLMQIGWRGVYALVSGTVVSSLYFIA